MILQNLAMNLMININCKLVLMIHVLNAFSKDFFFMKEMFESTLENSMLNKYVKLLINVEKVGIE